MKATTAEDSDSSFFSEAQLIADLYEELRKEFHLKHLTKVEQLVKDNSDLLVRHWKATLCMTSLSHDFIITHLCLLEILARMDESEIEEIFKFLLNLDRVIEIDIMQQLSSLIKTRPDVKLVAQIDYMRGTRSVIRNFIQNDLYVSPLNKSNVPCHLGNH